MTQRLDSSGTTINVKERLIFAREVVAFEGKGVIFWGRINV